MEGRLSPWHRRPVPVLGLVAVLFQYVDMLLCVAGFSLFLRRVGTASLPGFYVALNLASIVFMLVVLGRRRLSTFRLSLQLNLLLAVAVMAAIPFLSAAPPLFFFVLFLVIRLHDILCFTYFLTYVQTVFPVREAKRQIGLILGVSSGACVLAGLSVKPLVAWLSMEALFVVAATATILLVAAQILAGRRWPPPEGRAEEERSDEGARHPLAETLAVLRRSSLAENVVKVFFLTTLLRYLIEFQYSKALVLLFPDEVELAGFVGIFKAGISVLVTLGQVFLTHRLLARWRTGGTMALAPLLELLLCGLVLVHPAAVPVLLVQGGWTLGYHVATRPAFNLLLVPLSAAARDRVSLLSTLAGSLGSLFSGLVLVVLGDALGLRPFFFVVALLYLLTRGLADRLDGDYLESLEKRITSTDAAAKLEALRALRDLGGGARRDHLARLLADGDPEVRLEALRHLGALATDDAETLVHGVFENEADSRIRATLARSLPEILGPRAADLVLRWLGEDDDPRTRANLVEALGALGREEDGVRLLPLLENENDRIRANAATSLLQIARDDGHLRRGLEELAALARSPVPERRGAALVAMGRLRRPVFRSCVIAALDDGSPAVRRNALRALAELRAAESLERLARMGRDDPDPSLREEAKRLEAEIREQKTDDWLRLARRLDGTRRRRVMSLLRAAGGGTRASVLEGLLRYEDREPSPELLDGLRLCRDETLLAAAAESLGADPPRLAPLVALLDGGGSIEADALRLLGDLLRFLPAELRLAAVETRLSILSRLEPLLDDEALPPETGDLARRARNGLRESLLSLVSLVDDRTARDDEAGRRAVVEALAQTVSDDGHQASLALDFLESRLDGTLFALLAPQLERKGASPSPSPPPAPPPAEDSSLRAVLGAFLDASETEALLHALAPEEGTPR